MKTKKVNRYECDFCGKRKYSSSHMKRHEEVCTKNPKRLCRCCKFVNRTTKDIADLIKLLPKVAEFKRDDCSIHLCDELTIESNKCLEKLRAETNNCPACIMAAIRQSGIPVPMVTDFDYAKELKNVMDDYNDTQALYSGDY